MRTTPKGEMRRLYTMLTKGELFWAACSYYQLKYEREINPADFVQLIRQETKLWLK